ncbi:hypothetical protein N7532_008334 [Penicillium argentinense]|uniref:DUF6590 domain-containing protein n=1 Tax=Penicillium argentinense TaxID=1131581 RepID=A0A9W9EXH3_9EURO|nr:uncharacterized protein N7532_008334 [Penicillium argentinense]KAJ5089650.1 hypothetical protein N7532_008334 [Penicillium argentinense]
MTKRRWEARGHSTAQQSGQVHYRLVQETVYGRTAVRDDDSDRSDRTVSSRSDASNQRSISEDLQGLSLFAHVSSQMIPGCVASFEYQHTDPTRQRVSLGPSYVIPATTGDHDTLDPPSRPAEIFQLWEGFFCMLWHEDARLNGIVSSQKHPLPPNRRYSTGKYQEPTYSSIRRIIVIKEQKGCCWCLYANPTDPLDRISLTIFLDSPITPYSGQDIAKSGVDRNRHAVIYMRGTRPTTRANEARMTKDPIEVRTAKQDQKLDSISRINFGKVYTVEHNIKSAGSLTRHYLGLKPMFGMNF